jgi:hypothetical protein
VTSSWILFFSYQDDARSNIHKNDGVIFRLYTCGVEKKIKSNSYTRVVWEGAESCLLDSRVLKKLTSITKMEAACFCRMFVFTHEVIRHRKMLLVQWNYRKCCSKTASNISFLVFLQLGDRDTPVSWKRQSIWEYRQNNMSFSIIGQYRNTRIFAYDQRGFNSSLLRANVISCGLPDWLSKNYP